VNQSRKKRKKEKKSIGILSGCEDPEEAEGIYWGYQKAKCMHDVVLTHSIYYHLKFFSSPIF